MTYELATAYSNDRLLDPPRFSDVADRYGHTGTPVIAPRPTDPTFTPATYGRGRKIHRGRVVAVALHAADRDLPEFESMIVATHPECQTVFSCKAPGGTDQPGREITCVRCCAA